ncbi:MAG: DsbA family protein [Novosphingobium sp.]
MTRFRSLALAATALLTLAAGPAPRANWNATVAATPAGGYRLGNPAATVKVIEHASYTCPHCAEFEVQGTDRLRLAYVAGGKVSFEVRPYVRDPIDLTVAMLATCGDPGRFFLNHAAFMRSQSTWMRPLQSMSAGQQQRWFMGEDVARRRAIAADFKLYAIAATRGIDRIAADRCLGDQAKARRLAEVTAESDRIGVSGTPSFQINGNLLAATYEWDLLEPQIRAAL